MQSVQDFLYGTNSTVGDDWLLNSTSAPMEDGDFTPWFFVRAVFGTSVVLVTLLGNLLVLYAFATTQKLRTYTNYYLVGLAAADLVSGGIVPFLENVYWIMGTWPFGEAVCTISVYINHLFLHATFLMTLTICVDRYRALTRPLRHLRKKTLRHAIFMMSFSYAIPFMIWTPLIVILPYSGVTSRVLPPICHGSYAYHFLLLVFVIAVMSWIPMLATVILYIFVFRAVLRGSGRQNADNREGRDLYRVPVNPAMERELREVRQSGNDCGWGNKAQSNENQDAAQSSTGDLREKQAAPISSTHVESVVNEGYHLNEQDNETKLRGVVQSNHRQDTDHRHVTNPNQPTSKFHRLAGLRATRTLTCIIVVMVVSALPWSILAFLGVVDPHSAPGIDLFMDPNIVISVLLITFTEKCYLLQVHTHPAPTNCLRHIYETMSWLVHLSSAINPFCYAFNNPQFKQAFLRTLRCGRRVR